MSGYVIKFYQAYFFVLTYNVLISVRHQLNCKKNKVDDYPIRKLNSYSPQNLAVCLSNASSNEGLKDETKSLSRSLVGGSMNVSKIRVLTFWLPERVVQGMLKYLVSLLRMVTIYFSPILICNPFSSTGNVVSVVPKLRTRMIMSEKPSDGTVAMHYGDIDDGDFLAAEDHLPTLPNTVSFMVDLEYFFHLHLKLIECTLLQILWLLTFLHFILR